MRSAPASIIANAASLALGGSYQEPIKVTRKSISGLISWAPAMKACISRFTSGDRIATHHPDKATLGLRSCNQACEVGAFLDEIVEYREVRFFRPKARAHEEGRVWIVGGNLACSPLYPEHLADHELVPGFGIFAHHPLIVGILDILGEGVVDLTPARLPH